MEQPTTTSSPSTPAEGQLEAVIQSGDQSAAMEYLDALSTPDAVRELSHLDDEERAGLLAMLGPEDAAPILSMLPEPQQYDAIEDLDPAIAAKIVEQLPSDEQADLIGELETANAEAIIGHLEREEAEDVRRLVAYDDDVAGGLMVTEYLAYPGTATIRHVIEDLGANAEEYARYDIQYAYVTGDAGELIGVLRMRDLLLAPRSRELSQIMIPSPASVRDDDTLEHLVAFFEEHRFFGVPVIDSRGVICGVVQQSAVEAAVAEDSERLYRAAQGIVGGEELRTMPLIVRSRRRLSWLSINIVLNMIAASVIAMHQDTLEAVIALAVFLPIISDMSGCSGNQAVAVSMRELTLGVIRPTDLLRTILAEVSVGLINGLALGALLGAVAFLWKGQPYLGLVVGVALALNTVVAVVIGGSVPLLLKRAKVDPALAAGPILTTVTDMCGFFIVLTIASSMLDRLT